MILSNANIIYLAGGSAGIRPSTTDGDIEEVARYNTQGILLTRPEKGLNIIRRKNGTVEKLRVE